MTGDTNKKITVTDNKIKEYITYYENYKKAVDTNNQTEAAKYQKKMQVIEKDLRANSKGTLFDNKYTSDWEQKLQTAKTVSDSKKSTSVPSISDTNVSIGGPSYTPQPSATDTAQQVDWTKEQKDTLRQDNKAAGDSIVDDYNTDKQRSTWDPYWNKNNAKDNWRGNLNNKSYRSTLNLSRAADALNNRRFWDPGTGGRRTNSGFGTNEAQLGHSERWEPIETQETRQMRANERLDERARQADVDLAADVRRNTFDMQQQNQQMQFALAQAMGMTDMQLKDYMKRGQFDMEYKRRFEQHVQEQLQTFAGRLQLSLRSEALGLALKEYAKNPEVASLISQALLGGVQMPTLRNMLISQMTGELSGKGLSAYDQLRAINGMLQQLGLQELSQYEAASKGIA